MKKINKSYYVMNTLNVAMALFEINKILDLVNLEIKNHEDVNQERQSVEISLFEKEDLFERIKKSRDINLLKKLFSENEEQRKKINEVIKYLKENI